MSNTIITADEELFTSNFEYEQLSEGRIRVKTDSIVAYAEAHGLSYEEAIPSVESECMLLCEGLHSDGPWVYFS